MTMTPAGNLNDGHFPAVCVECVWVARSASGVLGAIPVFARFFIN